MTRPAPAAPGTQNPPLPAAGRLRRAVPLAGRAVAAAALIACALGSGNASALVVCCSGGGGGGGGGGGSTTNGADPILNTSVPIDFGDIHLSSSPVTVPLSITNALISASVPQDSLDVQASATGAAFAAGRIIQLLPNTTDSSSIVAGLEAGSAGPQSGEVTLTYASDATNLGCTSACVGAASTQSFAVSGTVYRLASPNVPIAIELGATRVGGTPLVGGITVTNTAPNDGYSENLVATALGASGVFTAAGTTGDIAPQSSNSSGITASLASTTAGAYSGTVQLAMSSDGAGVDTLGLTNLGTQSVNVYGSVYTPAVAEVTPAVNFGVVHVGQAATGTVVATNAALPSALNDSLTGSLSTSSAPFTAGGSIMPLAPGASDPSHLTVGLDTSTAGLYTGTAQFNGESVDPQLAPLALAPVSVALVGQVNNYVNPLFQLGSGSGTLSQSGSAFTLDFGNLTQGSSVSSLLDLINSVSGPSDFLSGSFGIGTTPSSFLTGANWGAPFSGLGAGGILSGLGIDVGTGTLGNFSDTLTLYGIGSYVQAGGSPYSTATYSPYAADITLTLEGDVVSAGTGGPGGSAGVPETGSLPLFAAGVWLLVGLARRRLAVTPDA